MNTPARILAVLAALAISACGNDPDVAANTQPPTSATTTTATLEATNDNPAATPERAVTTTAPAENSATRSTTAPGNGPDATSPPDEQVLADTYAPSPGTYVYDATGTIETTGLTTSKEPVPPTSSDTIEIQDNGNGTLRMTVVTREEGESSSQELVVDVTPTEARLQRLTYRSDDGLAYDVTPNPPALLARTPYQDSDHWEIAWNDATTGISGAGTGSVERHETITTPAGRFDTVVIQVTQRLRGTITGTLTITSWIEPNTGIQARQHVITDLQTATGASRTDTTRNLREHSA